jgi:hypothetical protein
MCKYENPLIQVSFHSSGAWLLFAITSSCLRHSPYVQFTYVSVESNMYNLYRRRWGCIYIAISLSCTRSHTGSYLEALVHNMLYNESGTNGLLLILRECILTLFFLIIYVIRKLIKAPKNINTQRAHIEVFFLGKFKKFLTLLQNGKFTWTPCYIVHLMMLNMCNLLKLKQTENKWK